MHAFAELKFIAQHIKDSTPMQNQSNNDLTNNSEDVSCITPTEDHLLEGVEDKGTKLISADDIDEDNVNHIPQKVEEEHGQADIEEGDLVSKETNHPMDPSVMLVSKKSTRSS